MHNADYYKKGIEKMFQIVDMEMSAVPFILNPPQDKINKELGNMDIILKARQEGISSLIGARFLVDWLTVENSSSVIISHEDKATQRLFDRVKYFLDSMGKTWPGDLPYKLKFNSRHEIVNLKMNSRFYVGTAGSRAFGRGDTINNLHISELSMWQEQEKIMIGLLQAVPKDGNIVIESTANGIGDYFYKLCVRAREGSSPFRFHFLPWFDLPGYVMPVTYPMELTPEEQTLINQYGLKREQIAWRRWKINQMNGDWRDPATWDKFQQEFPSNADEAFIVSGNPVWSPTLLKHYLTKTTKPLLTGYLRGFSPVSVEPNEKGYLKVYKEPNEFHTYAIGVDVSEGRQVEEGGGRERDASCAQVFDKTTYEQVAVWHGRIDADRLGRELDLLGRYYNEALIGVERNAVGITPLIILRDLNYPNLYYREQLGMIADKITAELGWLTTSQSKESLIADATNLLRDKRIVINDEQTVSEMMSFVRDAEGRAKGAKSAYDDRVMAFLISLRMLSRAKSTSNVNEIEKDDMDRPRGFFMDGQSFDERGMPTHPDSMQGDLYQGDEF